LKEVVQELIETLGMKSKDDKGENISQDRLDESKAADIFTADEHLLHSVIAQDAEPSELVAHNKEAEEAEPVIVERQEELDGAILAISASLEHRTCFAFR
jgi:hypothetical protein